MAATPVNGWDGTCETRVLSRSARSQGGALEPPAMGEPPGALGAQSDDALRDAPVVSLQLEDSGLFAQRYRPEVEVGRGGAGVVYRATDVDTGDTVALKVLQTEHLVAVSGLVLVLVGLLLALRMF